METRPRSGRLARSALGASADLDAADGAPLEFSELQLSAPVLRGLADAGFERPSPIQARAIPLGRFGVDLIAQAKSGTGKTVVFAAIALELVRPDQPAPQALIVAPTREIALQCRDVCRIIGAHLRGINCHGFVGGTPVRTDRATAAVSHVACGTPGRLVDLLLAEALVASRVRLLVLDEADKLCGDEGFEEQLRYLLTSLPMRKQSLAFSATYPASLLEVLRSSMRSPLTISLLPSARGGADEDEIDPRDPLALLERPESLGGGVSLAVSSSAAVAGSVDSAAVAGSADSAEGAYHSAHVAGDNEAAGAELVGRASLVGVRQYYRVVGEELGEGTRSGGAGAGAAGGRGGGRGSSARRRGENAPPPPPPQQQAMAKQHAVLELLDRVTFHQALVFCNRAEEAAKLTRALDAAGFPSAYISVRELERPRPRRHRCAAKALSLNAHTHAAITLISPELPRSPPISTDLP